MPIAPRTTSEPVRRRFQPTLSNQRQQPLATSDQRLLAGIAVSVVILDTLSKWILTRHFEEADTAQSIDLIGARVSLRLSENSGIAFGLLEGQSFVVGVVVAVGVLALSAFGWRTAAVGGRWSALAFGLLIGGALGNILDRIDDGNVTDFIVVGSWPSFNVADSAITVGAILLILWLVFDGRETYAATGYPDYDDRPDR